MTLRTAALIAGALGVVLLAVGLISQAIKPAAEARPSAALTTTVAVFPPQVLALAPEGAVSVTGDGPLVAHLARTVDADAWLASRKGDTVSGTATWETITGIEDWDHLAVSVGRPPVVTSPSPTPGTTSSTSPSASPKSSPSASPKSSPSTSPKSSPSTSPSASPSPSPTVSTAEPMSVGSQDTWRATESTNGTYSVRVATLPAGLTLVVDSPSGAPLTRAFIATPRVIDDAWISQLLWWGVGLTIVGLIALVFLFIDMRPVQTKGESWMAYRAGIGSGKKDPRPGSRRARRQAGVSMPVASLDEDEAPATTSDVPAVDESAPDESIDDAFLAGADGDDAPGSGSDDEEERS